MSEPADAVGDGDHEDVRTGELRSPPQAWRPTALTGFIAGELRS